MDAQRSADALRYHRATAALVAQRRAAARLLARQRSRHRVHPAYGVAAHAARRQQSDQDGSPPLKSIDLPERCRTICPDYPTDRIRSSPIKRVLR